VETAKPVAFYDHPFFGRWPAITRNRYGTGTLTYEGTALSDKLQDIVVLDTLRASGLASSDQQLPPTVRLTNDVFGSKDAPIIFGWIVAGHQLGAAFAALLAGVLRNSLGTYTVATMISGALCLVAAVMVLRINRRAYALAAA